MKTCLLLFALILPLRFFSQGPHQPASVKRLYRVWINGTDTNPVKKGVIYYVSDTMLRISDSKFRSDYSKGTFSTEAVELGTIQSLKIRKVGKVNRSALIGLGAGFMTATLAGVLFGQSWESAENMLVAFAAASWAGGIGAAAGALIGSVKITIPMEKNRARHKTLLGRLNAYAAVDNPELRQDYPVMPANVYTQVLTEVVMDADGNTYKTIRVCDQVWMAEDLRTGHYSGGDTIPLVTGKDDWQKTRTGASCRVGDTVTENPSPLHLYNGAAVRGGRSLCPSGWHIPSLDEWLALTECVGDEREGRLDFLEIFNASGRDNPPGGKLQNTGFRFSNGDYSAPGGISFQWWSSTTYDSTGLKSVHINRLNGLVSVVDSKTNTGYPVRCVKN